MALGSFWNRKPKQPTMDMPVVLDEPPFFEGWRTVRLFLMAFVFIVLAGSVGVGAIFFSGIETTPTQSKTLIPLDNSILRE